MWALPAHLIYGVYLLAIIGQGVRRRGGAGKGRTLLVSLMPLVLVIMAYTPSGWAFPHRVLLCAAVIALALRHWPTTPRAQNTLTAAVSLSLAVLLTYGADRAVGAAAGKRQPGGLIFPRYSTVAYQTPEFSHHVRVNGYGFRGPDVDLSADVDCRVMLLGDSFTYGWGVDYAQTWAALLSQQLSDEGLRAQVMNLGVPGGNPPDYAAIAEAAAPLLRPDVVIVGVLQGDDMRQMSREASVFPRPLNFGEVARPAPITEYVSFHYPFIAERTVLAHTSARATRRRWAATAQGFIDGYTADQQSRYAALDAELRDGYATGQINPHFVHLAVTAPDYWAWPVQPPGTLAPYIADMSADFARIEAAAGARVIVASVPHGAYTQAQAHADLLRFGFVLPPELLQSDAVDSAIAEAAAGAGLPFVSVTDAFRAHDALAFYPVDGHFNAEGNRLFAAEIAPTVRDACSR